MEIKKSSERLFENLACVGREGELYGQAGLGNLGYEELTVKTKSGICAALIAEVSLAKERTRRFGTQK